MKRSVLIIFLLFIGLTACKKKLTQFYIDYNTSATIPSNFSTLVPISFSTPEMESNSEAEFESNDTKKKYVKSIYLADAVLSITSPSGETFSFLNEVEVYLYNSNIGEKRIAHKLAIPSSAGTELILDLDNVDLQEYIKEDSFTLRIKYTTDETIPQDVNINIYTNYLVEAKLKLF